MTIMQLRLPVVFPAAAGGVNQPRWQQQHGRLAGARTRTQADSGHAIFHVSCWGASLRPASSESSYFESDPSFRQRLCSCQEP